MDFKKHNWLEFSRVGKIIEIAIKECDGKRLDFFRCNNEPDFNKVAKIIRDKYGFNFEPEIKNKDSVNNINNKEKKGFFEKDLSF